MLTRIRNFFVTTILGGLLVLLPITLFVWVFGLVVRLIRQAVEPIAKLFDFGKINNELLLDTIAVTAIILFCFMVGLLTQTRIGKGFFNQLDKVMSKQLPFYGSISNTVQQFMGTKEMPFSKVVLVNVFETKTKMLGFISEEHPNEKYTVFVPTAPNPTNGFLFHVYGEQLEFLDVKPEEAMRVVIGVGLGADQFF